MLSYTIKLIKNKGERMKKAKNKFYSAVLILTTVLCLGNNNIVNAEEEQKAIDSENIKTVQFSDFEDTDTEAISELETVENPPAFEFRSEDIVDSYDEVELPAEVSADTFADTGHTTPNTALFLDSSYMGKVLTDTANEYENWYFFKTPEKQKISAILEQPQSGDYDLYLYEYHEDGTLTLVSYSLYLNSASETLSHIAKDGFYFLRIVPVAAANSTYNFIISLIESFDSNEPNDNIYFANDLYRNIYVNNTIDNAYDNDWMKLTVPSTATYNIFLSSVPYNTQYAVHVYDETSTYLGSVVGKTSDTLSAITLKTGTYYFCVQSYNGTFSNSPYFLKVVDKNVCDIKITKTGKIVELTDTAITVNGRKVDMNWSYHYTGQYRRIQDVTTSENTTFLKAMKNGTYSGPQSVTSSDCIMVAIDNFVYDYWYGPALQFESIKFGDGKYVIFYVDAIEGKVIDTEVNYYYHTLNMPQIFNEF